MLTALSLIYFILILSFIYIDGLFSKNIFSAVKLASYFSLINAFVLLWFSIRPQAIEKYIFSTLSAGYHHYEYVYFAYIFTIVTYLVVITGVFLGSYSSGLTASFLSNRFFRFHKLKKIENLKTANIVFLLAFIIYVIFIFKVGGLGYLWSNLHLRTQLTAGLGYYHAVYSFLIFISIPVIYVRFVSVRKYFKFVLYLIPALIMLGSLGQRAPAIILIFVLLLTHHYIIKDFRSVFNFKTIILVFLSLFFMFYFVQFRVGSAAGSQLENFERNVIQRLGNIERQVAVIGYFDNHEFWGFGVYKSLLYAYIPRSYYKDKPPVDTGVYINQIRQGVSVNPPQPISELQPSSWPDGHLAGYVSFGLFGLIVVGFMAGWVYGVIYRVMIKSSYQVTSIMLFASMGFMGVKSVSPLDIVSILMIVIPILVLGVMFSFKKVRNNF